MEMVRDLVPSADVNSFQSADDDGGADAGAIAPPSSLSAALSVRDGLRAKADAVRAAIEALDEERKTLAFSAHTGNEAAEKKLASLNKKRLMLIADEEMISVAHIEASRKVADAERAEELAMDGQKASRAAEIAMDLVGPVWAADR